MRLTIMSFNAVILLLSLLHLLDHNFYPSSTSASGSSGALGQETGGQLPGPKEEARRDVKGAGIRSF